MATGGKPITVFTVPTRTLNRRLDMPSPNMYRPIPLTPCSAFRVTLTRDMSSPRARPTSAAARSPSQRLPVVRVT